MILSPLNEDQAAARILEVVPPTFRAEVARNLRMIQFANLMLGFDEGHNSCRREWALKGARADLWNTFTDTEVPS